MPNYRLSSVLYDANAPPLRGKEPPSSTSSHVAGASSPSIIPSTPSDYFNAAEELEGLGQRRRAVAMLRRVSEPLLKKPKSALTQDELNSMLRACIWQVGLLQGDPIGDVEGLGEAVEAAANVVDIHATPATFALLGWAQHLRAIECSNPRIREEVAMESLESYRHALRLLPSSTLQSATSTAGAAGAASQIVTQAALVLAMNGLVFDAVEVLESSISNNEIAAKMVAPEWSMREASGRSNLVDSTRRSEIGGAEESAPSPIPVEPISEASLLLLALLYLALERTDSATVVLDRLCMDNTGSAVGRAAEFVRVLCVYNLSGGSNRALVDYQIRSLMLKLTEGMGALNGLETQSTEETQGGRANRDLSTPQGSVGTAAGSSEQPASNETLPPSPSSLSVSQISATDAIRMLLIAARVCGIAGSFNTAFFAINTATRLVESEAAQVPRAGKQEGEEVPILNMEPACVTSSPSLLMLAAMVSAEKGRLCTWKASASGSTEDRTGGFEAAGAQFVTALGLHRFNYEAQAGRAAAIRDSGKSCVGGGALDSVAEYRRLLGMYPRSVEVAVGLVTCCRAGRQLRVAVDDHVTAIPRSSTSGEFVSTAALAIYAAKLAAKHGKGHPLPLEWFTWIL